MSDYSQKGVSLYLVIIAMAVVLAIVFGITTILLKQIKLVRGMEDSVMAYYAAETGLEEALKDIIKDGAVDLPEYPHSVDLNENTSYEVKAVCCRAGTGNCVFGQEEGGSCPGLGYSCPEGMEEDDNCSAPSYCITSKGSYKNTERVIEVKYGLSQIIQYDYFNCGSLNQSDLSFQPIGRSTAGGVWLKTAQTFIPDQSYKSSSVEMIMKRYSGSGDPKDITVSIQGVRNDNGSDITCSLPYDGSHIFDYPDGNKICQVTINSSELTTSEQNIILPWDDECYLQQNVMYFLVVEGDITDLDSTVLIKRGSTGESSPTCGIIETPCHGDIISYKQGWKWRCRYDCYGPWTAKASLVFSLWRCPLE